MLIREDDLFGLQSGLMTCRFSLASGERLQAQILDARLAEERARTVAATESAALHDQLWQARADQLAQQLVAAQRSAERGWWESGALWFAIGLVVAAAVGVAFAVAVR
jgi:anti-sigma-K factor RskA